jgi:hypothetical protein
VIYTFAAALTIALGAWLLWRNRSSRPALAWSVLALGGLFAALVFVDQAPALSAPARWCYVVGVVAAIGGGLYGAHRSRRQGGLHKEASGGGVDEGSSRSSDRRS